MHSRVSVEPVPHKFAKAPDGAGRKDEMSIKGVFVIFVVVLTLLVGLLALFGRSAGGSVGEGGEYQVMLYSCVSPEDGRPMVDVHFVGTDREMQPQLVPAELVVRVQKGSALPSPGSGYFTTVRYGTADGVDYGWRREFHFNGNLQPLSIKRECPERK